ncbi:B12-binding domain-containing radical SAM protein [Nitrospinaceae bacterium]|nr:B12-binding domain-containing radical SAM protein [Nitrospinaceae bacterium]
MKKRLLLVWPSQNGFGIKPIGLAQLSAIVKAAGHPCDLFDSTYIDLDDSVESERTTNSRLYKPVKDQSYYRAVKKQKLDLKTEYFKKLNEFQPDIIGISALSDERHLGFELSRLSKEWNKNTVVVWGNKLCTMDPEAVLKNESVDYVCRGEGYNFILEFIKCMENGEDPRSLNNIGYRTNEGKVELKPLSSYYQELDNLPYLDMDIFDERHFLKVFQGKVYRGAEHMLLHGCPLFCSYCLVDAYRDLYKKDGEGGKEGKYMRGYSTARITEELKFLTEKHDIGMWKFYDEEFGSKPMKMFRDLAESYKKHINLPFCCTANAWNLGNEKVNLLAKMGCANVSMGFESGSEELRTMVLKRKETREDIINTTSMLKNAGIRTSAYNLIGLPYETRSTIFQTVELNKAAGVQDPSVNFWYPLEGTGLRDIAIEEGFYEPAEYYTSLDYTRPYVTLPDLSDEEMRALKKCLHLYIKLPYEFFKYIQRTESGDEFGQKLFAELLDIHERNVLDNNGLWDENIDIKAEIKALNDLFPESIEIKEFDFDLLKQNPIGKSNLRQAS